jgi:hypothetical protein
LSIVGPYCAPVGTVTTVELLGVTAGSANFTATATDGTSTSTTWALSPSLDIAADNQFLPVGDYVSRLTCADSSLQYAGLSVRQTIDSKGNGAWVTRSVATHTLSIHVTAGDRPAAQSGVSVFFGASSQPSLSSGETDANGEVTFVVPDGAYRVAAYVASTVPGGDYQPIPPVDVNVTADTSVTLLSAPLPGPLVTGTVRDADGRGVPAATISFAHFWPGVGTFAFAVTDSGGRYSVRVPEGTQKVSLSASPHAGLALPPGQWSMATAADAVSASGDVMSGDITLPAPVTLHVSVTDASGALVPGVTITPTTEVVSSVSSPDARFNVAPGSATLLGAPIGYGYVEVAADDTMSADGTATFRTFPSAPGYLAVDGAPSSRYFSTNIAVGALSVDTSLTVPLATGHTVTGRLLDHRGTPVTNGRACLHATRPLPAESRARSSCGGTDSSGHFSIYAIPQHYGLTVSTNGRASGADVPTDAWTLALGTDTVTLTGDADWGDLTLPAPVRIGLRLVAGADGSPVRNAKLFWEQAYAGSLTVTAGFASVAGHAVSGGSAQFATDTADPYPSVVTDANGEAELIIWPVGAILVDLSTGTGPSLRSRQIDTAATTAITLQESPGSLITTAIGMTLAVTPDGRITPDTPVSVTATFVGAPANSTVTLSLDAPGSRSYLATTPVVADSATFALGALPRGTHVVTASLTAGDGRALSAWTRSVEVTVASGDTMTGADLATEFLDAHVADGALTITVQGFVTPSPTTPVSGNVVTLPEAELDASAAFIVTSGPIVPVVVADTRAGDLGYSVIGSLSDFVGTAGSIAATHVGWTPQFVGSTRFPSAPTASEAGLSDGGVVPPVDDGRAGGLATSRLLFSAPAGGSNGSVTYGADLVVHAPTATLPGNYRATLTITVVG